MATDIPPSAPPKAAELSAKESARRKDVKKLLILFAVLSFLAILILLVSFVLGLVVLVVAEAFFAYAFLRFSRREQVAREEMRLAG